MYSYPFGSVGPSDLVFAPGTPHELKVSTTQNTVIVVRFSANGTPVWASAVGTEPGSILPEHLAASPRGVVVTGTFPGTATFGSAPLTAAADPYAGTFIEFLST